MPCFQIIPSTMMSLSYLDCLLDLHEGLLQLAVLELDLSQSFLRLQPRIASLTHEGLVLPMDVFFYVTDSAAIFSHLLFSFLNSDYTVSISPCMSFFLGLGLFQFMVYCINPPQGLYPSIKIIPPSASGGAYTFLQLYQTGQACVMHGSFLTSILKVCVVLCDWPQACLWVCHAEH